MKKYLNIVLCCFFMLAFTGCSDNTDGNKENKETTTTINSNPATEPTTESATKEEDYDYNAVGSSGNEYRKVDGEYGLSGVPIEYESGEVEIGIDRTYTYEKNGTLLDMDLDIYTLIVCNGELVECGINGSDKSIVQRFNVHNGERYFYDVNFIPYGLSENGEAEVFAIDIAEPSRYAVDDNGRSKDIETSMPVSSEFKIVSVNGGKTPENAFSFCNENYIVNKINISDGVYINDEIEYLFSHNITMGVGVNPEEDFILEMEDGTYQFWAVRNLKKWYSDDTDEDSISESYITLLFCDRELYPAFDGSYVFKWETVGPNVVTKELDLSGLEKGEHELFTVTYYINNHVEICSQLTNIEIE